MQKLEQAIGYTFRDRTLLEQALSHSSYANEVLRDGLKSYERLEFLGDSVLGFLTADYLYRQYPKLHEGELTKLRSELVCEKSLELTGKQLGLGSYLRLGKGEAAGGGRTRASIVADVVEATLAAIYLDGGFEPARDFVYRFVLSDAKEKLRLSADYKTMLQELVQRKKDQVLEYHLLDETGPDHEKQFSVSVTLNGETVGEGTGTSKKRAEQAAAKAAIEQLFPDAI